MTEVTTRATDVGGVFTVDFSRPPENRMDSQLIGSLADALEVLDRNDQCRAVVLRSEGRHFCAGASLDPKAVAASPTNRHLYDEAVRIFAFRKPIVACVQGAAVGGGLGLALAADFRVGAASSRLTANFSMLGFHHGFGISVTLPAVVGQQKALYMLYTGHRLKGDEALKVGLLDRLVADEDLREEALRMASEIAAAAPLAVTSIRATMRAGLAERVRKAMAHERSEQERLRQTADFREGLAAVAEHRIPAFEGR